MVPSLARPPRSASHSTERERTDASQEVCAPVSSCHSSLSTPSSVTQDRALRFNSSCYHWIRHCAWERTGALLETGSFAVDAFSRCSSPLDLIRTARFFLLSRMGFVVLVLLCALTGLVFGDSKPKTCSDIRQFYNSKGFNLNGVPQTVISGRWTVQTCILAWMTVVMKTLDSLQRQTLIVVTVRFKYIIILCYQQAKQVAYTIQWYSISKINI